MYKAILAALALVLLLASCGGGSSITSDTGDNSPAFTPDRTASAYNSYPGDPEFGSYWIDDTPDNYEHFCSVYGQWYVYGGAEIVKDPAGEDPGWYAHYWLSDDAIADGWGFSEVHVNYTIDQPDPKKGGIPGHYPYAWQWDMTPTDMPPTEVYLAIGDYDPAIDYYLSLHSVIIKGYWYDSDPETEGDQWAWETTDNETGWSGYCESKVHPDGDYWEGTWKNKWGGYVKAYGNLPIWTPFIEWDRSFYPNGTTSYWQTWFDLDNDDFGGNPPLNADPGTFPWVMPQENPFVGWCTDPSGMVPGAHYRMCIVSCYDIPTLLGTRAESNHWDSISWIINQMHNGDGSKWYHREAGNPNYNYRKVQRAIWALKFLDIGMPPGGDDGSGYNESNADVAELISDALTYGDGYYPGPGEWYAAITIPCDADGNFTFTSTQMNIIEVDP